MESIHELLTAATAGKPAASARLFETVYTDLKRLAHGRLLHGGRIEGLDTTALVHESFLRLADSRQVLPTDRPAFFGYVGRVMRSVVIDLVRERQSLKRGGDQQFVTLTTGVEAGSLDEGRLLAVDAALVLLERIDPDLHRLVEMRYFAGLSVHEVAEILSVSKRSVERRWEKARALLQNLIDEA